MVIAESVGERAELAEVARSVPAGTSAVTVVVTCAVETALERALADPTRGVSRDEGFLRRAHEHWTAEQPLISADLVLDIDTTEIDDSVGRIRMALERTPPMT